MNALRRFPYSKKTARPAWMLFATALVISLLPGCSTSGMFSKFSNKEQFQKATPSNPAVRCLCLWEPAEGTGVDDKPARGVAGQIFFFTRDSVSSVAVEGDVRIFMFDDQGTEEEQGKPFHNFDFKDNSFRTYLKPTQFGPAYQLFVPYSRKGRHQAELAVRVRLGQPGSSPVFSELTKVVLAGHERLPSKPTSESSTTDPAASDTPSVDHNDATDNVTPKLIEQTFRDIQRERQSPPVINRRASISSGEFNVADDVEEPLQQPARMRLRQSSHVEEEVEEAGEEQGG